MIVDAETDAVHHEFETGIGRGNVSETAIVKGKGDSGALGAAAAKEGGGTDPAQEALGAADGVEVEVDDLDLVIAHPGLCSVS